MTDYIVQASGGWAAKDTYPPGTALKTVSGEELGTEFSAIATAIASKADLASPTFTGTLTAGIVDANTLTVETQEIDASVHVLIQDEIMASSSRSEGITEHDVPEHIAKLPPTLR